MADELFESDVVFSDYHSNNNDSARFSDVDSCFDGNQRELNVKAAPPQAKNYSEERCGESGGWGNKKKKVAISVPVNIPQGMVRIYDSDEDEMVPPHVIVGRRLARKMAFSVCTGQGRTLKGRDLSQVRNSILRMTGFLEA